MSLNVGDAKLADLSLDFTLPGYGIELKVCLLGGVARWPLTLLQEGGAHVDVDDHNLEEYLALVLEQTLGAGITRQVQAFQEGKLESLCFGGTY